MPPAPDIESKAYLNEAGSMHWYNLWVNAGRKKACLKHCQPLSATARPHTDELTIQGISRHNIYILSFVHKHNPRNISRPNNLLQTGWSLQQKPLSKSLRQIKRVSLS